MPKAHRSVAISLASPNLPGVAWDTRLKPSTVLCNSMGDRIFVLSGPHIPEQR
jgi:hypothetical protein